MWGQFSAGGGAGDSLCRWKSVKGCNECFVRLIDVPLAKKPSTGTAQQQLSLVLKVVFHAVVVISEVLHLNTKSCCSRCYMARL